VVGTNDLLVNSNKQFILPKETNQNLKILSIFKNDNKLNKELKKPKKETSKDKSFKTFSTIETTTSHRSNSKKPDSMKELLTCKVNFREENQVFKVNQIPIKDVNLQRVKNL
jgi:hypothetical protein